MFSPFSGVLLQAMLNNDRQIQEQRRQLNAAAQKQKRLALLSLVLLTFHPNNLSRRNDAAHLANEALAQAEPLDNHIESGYRFLFVIWAILVLISSLPESFRQKTMIAKKIAKRNGLRLFRLISLSDFFLLPANRQQISSSDPEQDKAKAIQKLNAVGFGF